MYATGLLAIGLISNEACNEAVRNGMAVELAKVQFIIGLCLECISRSDRPQQCVGVSLRTPL